MSYLSPQNIESIKEFNKKKIDLLSIYNNKISKKTVDLKKIILKRKIFNIMNKNIILSQEQINDIKNHNSTEIIMHKKPKKINQILKIIIQI